MKKLAALLLFLAANVVGMRAPLAPALAQTAIRPDQISPATPDITWAPGGTGYQIGSTIPWRTITSATIASTAFTAATDAGRVIELTASPTITATLPVTTATGFGNGFGFTLQVAAGSLTLGHDGTAGTNMINGLDTIKIGPWQSVGLSSFGGRWYATLSIPQPATQTGTNVLNDQMAWVPAGTSGGPASCTDADNFITRTTAAGGAMGTSHQNAFKTLICGLVTDASGVWGTLDAFYVFATDTSAHANLNVKGATNTYTITAVGSPTFTADTGYVNTVVDQVTKYLDTGFNPTTATTPQYATTSATLAVYNLAAPIAGPDSVIGAYDGSIIASLLPYYTDGNVYAQMNVASSGLVSGAVSNATGLTVGTTNAGTMSVYRNSTLVNSASITSTGKPNLSFYIMLRHDSSGPALGLVCTIPVAAFGSGWDSAKVTAFYTFVAAYLDTIHGSH